MHSKTIINLVLLLIVISNINCSVNKSVSYYDVKYDEEINKDLYKEINSMNEKILLSIKQNNPKVFYDLTSAPLKNQDLQAIVKHYNSVLNHAKDIKIQKRNDYYIEFADDGNKEFVEPRSIDGEFEIKFNANNKNTYLSLYETEGGLTKFLISFLYCKENEEWKLFNFYIGSYKLDGKNAVQQFEYVQDLYSSNYKLPAFLRLKECLKYLKPAPFIFYKNEADILGFQEKLKKEMYLEYKFPIEFLEIKTKPQIYSIDNIFIKGDFVPVINYYSKIFSSDNSKLRMEMEEINSYIIKLFPGITKDSKIIMYHIFSAPPTITGFKIDSKVMHLEIKR